MSSNEQNSQQPSSDYGVAAAPGDLYVTFELVAKPGGGQGVRDLMIPIVAKARNAPGCKHCTLLEVQSEPDRIFTYEIWTERAALDAHMTTQRIKGLGQKLGALLAKPFTVTSFDAISSG